MRIERLALCYVLAAVVAVGVVLALGGCTVVAYEPVFTPYVVAPPPAVPPPMFVAPYYVPLYCVGCYRYPHHWHRR